jgi:hypothetical protein
METEAIATLLLSLKNSQSGQLKPRNHISRDESFSMFRMLPVDSPSTSLEISDVKTSPLSTAVNVSTSHKCNEVVPFYGYILVKVPSTLDCTILHTNL